VIGSKKNLIAFGTALQLRKSLGVSALLLSLSSCSVVASRPLQEMTNADLAIKAAKEVNADTLSPTYFRRAVDLYAKAKYEYGLKNFYQAKKLANAARKFAEQSEFISYKAGGATPEIAADLVSPEGASLDAESAFINEMPESQIQTETKVEPAPPKPQDTPMLYPPDDEKKPEIKTDPKPQTHYPVKKHSFILAQMSVPGITPTQKNTPRPAWQKDTEPSSPPEYLEDMKPTSDAAEMKELAPIYSDSNPVQEGLDPLYKKETEQMNSISDNLQELPNYTDLNRANKSKTQKGK
jgi:hypothetical protein